MTELPPLPEPTHGLGSHCWAYSAEDMHAYAAAARVQAIEECAALITPPEAIRRIDGAAYNNCINLASAIRHLMHNE